MSVYITTIVKSGTVGNLHSREAQEGTEKMLLVRIKMHWQRGRGYWDWTSRDAAGQDQDVFAREVRRPKAGTGPN